MPYTRRSRAGARVNRARLVRSAIAQRRAHIAGLSASHETLRHLGLFVGRTVIGRVKQGLSTGAKVLPYLAAAGALA